jgi:holo-[acyl-carrier protein] synthase
VLVPSRRIRIGVDIVGVERVGRLVGDDVYAQEQIFTGDELSYCLRKRRRDEHLAVRFAAKEAVLKALGTGLGQRMRWTDVEVAKDTTGRPRVLLHGEVAACAERQGVTSVEVSLTHAEGLAVAHAVAVREVEEGRACAST